MLRFIKLQKLCVYERGSREELLILTSVECDKGCKKKSPPAAAWEEVLIRTSMECCKGTKKKRLRRPGETPAKIPPSRQTARRPLSVCNGIGCRFRKLCMGEGMKARQSSKQDSACHGLAVTWPNALCLTATTQAAARPCVSASHRAALRVLCLPMSHHPAGAAACL